jgi:hypothetical protein
MKNEAESGRGHKILLGFGGIEKRWMISSKVQFGAKIHLPGHRFPLRTLGQTKHVTIAIQEEKAKNVG